ncbi:MAG: hypothetical protein JNK07_09745 [Alphaproteobacteria bacterium]|nr:hypothetical protein [Alphaproteobacteria bacterium]
MNNIRSAVCALTAMSWFASPLAMAAESPAPQQQAAPVQTDSAADLARKPGSMDEVICEVRDRPVTGTRISRKRQVCRTRREWIEEQQSGQDTLKKVQEAGRTSNGIKGASDN